MPVTVAGIETDVVGIVGGFYAAVGLATTTAGSNADLAGPILRGYVEALGKTPADPTLVVDADLSVITQSGTYVFLVDVAAREAMRKAMGKMTGVDIDVGDGSIKNSQLLASARSFYAELAARTAANSLKAARAFVSTLEKGAPMPNDPLRPTSVDAYTEAYP